MLAGVGQGTACAACVILALRSEALPEAAGSVGHASQENEKNENELHYFFTAIYTNFKNRV